LLLAAATGTEDNADALHGRGNETYLSIKTDNNASEKNSEAVATATDVEGSAEDGHDQGKNDGPSRLSESIETAHVLVEEYAPRSPEAILDEHTVDCPPAVVEWIVPPPEQESLISAVMGDSIGRRSNACGVIKTLAAKKGKAIILARTRGILDALVFAIKDLHLGIDWDASMEAYIRATIAISHLSEPKENRVVLAQHPDVVTTLIGVIEQDKGEARVAACRSLALLSKVQQNKALLVKADKLVTVLSGILSGRFDQTGGGDIQDFESGVGMSMSSNSQESRGRSQTSRGGDNSCNSSTVSAVSVTIRQCHSSRYQEFFSLARMNCCAAFSHLAKDCFASAQLGRHDSFLDAIVTLCNNSRSPMYSHCLEILCHLTRFPGNVDILASRASVIKILITSGKARTVRERLWALRSFQNLAFDSVSRISLATDPVLVLLSTCAFQGTKEEQDAAMGAIMNIALEPGTIISLTNTKSLIAILVNITNNTEPSSEVCVRARRTLKVIGTWINTLAGEDEQEDKNERLSLVPSGWMKWQ